MVYTSLLKRFLILATILIVAAACSPEQKQSFTTAYPQPLPDSLPLRFLPGKVCSDSLDFNAAFSPDGNRFYFSRSRKGKWMIYMTELDKNGSWSTPVVAPFNEENYSQADPFITDDGTIYYISNRPRHADDTIPDFDIWFVRPLNNNAWSKPVNVEGVNTDSTEYYVSLAANGNMYFASNRAGTSGSYDIYVSRYGNGVYMAPENLGPSINSDKMEHDPMISPDERYLIFTSVDRSDSYGEGDLYYSLRNPDGSWSTAQNMGKKFNTDTYEYCTYITPDNRFIFFSSNYDVKWISTSNLNWMFVK